MYFWVPSGEILLYKNVCFIHWIPNFQALRRMSMLHWVKSTLRVKYVVIHPRLNLPGVKFTMRKDFFTRQYMINYMWLVFLSSKWWDIIIQKHLFLSLNPQFPSFSKNSNATLNQILPPSRVCCYSPRVKFTQGKVYHE